MSNTKTSIKVAGILFAIAMTSPADCNAQAQPEITTPAVVVSVNDMKSLGLNSVASFALYNGGNAVSITAQGDITVNRSTDIRFILPPNAGSDYNVIGISFVQTDTNITDPVGWANFPTRTTANNVLVIRSEVKDAASFKYSIIFQRTSDGAIGIIDPCIKNGGNG